MHSKRSFSQLYSKTLKYLKINLLRNVQDEKIIKLYRRTEKARINSCVIFLDGKTEYGRDLSFPKITPKILISSEFLLQADILKKN